jgi:predicted membrane protein
MKKQIIPTLTLLVILVALGWYIDSVAHDEIVTVARLVVFAVAFIAIFAVLVGAIVLLLLIVERLLMVSARRKAAQCEADVLVVTADEDAQVYIRDMNKAANWRNAHLDSRVYINGQQIEPTPIEITNYQLRLARHQRRSITQVCRRI